MKRNFRNGIKVVGSPVVMRQCDVIRPGAFACVEELQSPSLRSSGGKCTDITKCHARTGIHSMI